MSKKIFWNILLVSLTVLFSALIFTLISLYRGYTTSSVEAMKKEAIYLSHAVNACGIDFLEDLEGDDWFTLVAADGTVQFDNAADGAQLENYFDQPEIQQALRDGIGYAERPSHTFSSKMTYVAVCLADDSVLRIAAPQQTIWQMLKNIAPLMLVILLGATLFSLLLASRVAKSITAPINRINLEHPEQTHVYAELKPLVNRISIQNQQINQQLADLRAEHEKQDAMRRDFTANVSHELKTPLTSISGYAEIIKAGIARSEDIYRFAGKIYDESQRLITLVGDIIKLSQLDGKEINVTEEEIDLYETCDAIRSQLEMALKERNVTMTLSGEHLKFYGASQIVEEIIFNLCDNAVKYNKPGGFVHVSLVQCMDGIELSVADTGIGIAQEDLPHIFERFYRVDKSHSKEIGGTGLGLSIVKHGVKFLDAKVTVESTLGKGTTIRILF